MAVSTSQQCDYEATLSRDEDGTYLARAISLQAARGSLPGLAGGSPMVRVRGGTIRIEADPAERPPASWTQWPLLPFFVIMPLGIRLNNWWVDRKERSAYFRALELSAPGIAEHARSGAILRVRYEMNAGPGIVTREVIEVTLRDDQGQIGLWQPDNFVSERW